MIFFECDFEINENEIFDEGHLRELTDEVVASCVALFDTVEKAGYDVSVYVVDDDYIHEINMQHRGVDRATDVLSFPMNEMYEGKALEAYEINEETRNILLGDIMISYPTCVKQAADYGHSVEREFAFLLTHGMMHLLGFDHVDDDKMADRMFAMQDKILNKLGITRDR